MKQFLSPGGDFINGPPPHLRDPNLIEYFYEIIVRSRLFDQKAVNLQRTGRIGTYASCLGQEAIYAAIGKALEPKDSFHPYYRDYPVMLQRGVTMLELYQNWGGDERGNDTAKSRHDFPFSIPIASQCLHAAGVAKTFQYKKIPQAALVTLGEGGTSQGDFYEAMNIAGIWQLPVIFVVNNNQWAISIPRAQQTAAQTIAQKATAAGFTGEQVDGNDVLAVYDSVNQALNKARAGKGPSLIEAVTYRLCHHTTADDASRYVDPKALDAAWKIEPLIRLEKFLQNNQGINPDIKIRAQQEVNTAVTNLANLSKAPVTDIFDYHYAKLPPELLEQRLIASEEAEHG